MVYRTGPVFSGMNSSTRPRPLPPASEMFTALMFDATAVHAVKHPNGDVVTSTKYTVLWAGTTCWTTSLRQPRRRQRRVNDLHVSRIFRGRSDLVRRQ